MMVVMAGFGLTTTTRIIVGFTYLTEMFPKKRQVVAVTINLVENSTVYILGTIYFWQVSRNWFYFVLFGYIVSVTTCLMSFFVPESPRFLLAHGKLEETKKAINLIAKFNFKPPIDWSKIDLSAAKSDKEQLTAQFTPFIKRYTLSIKNLPPNTDLPTFHRMMSRRMTSLVDLSQVEEKVDLSAPHSPQRSFHVSFENK